LRVGAVQVTVAVTSVNVTDDDAAAPGVVIGVWKVPVAAIEEPLKSVSTTLNVYTTFGFSPVNAQFPATPIDGLETVHVPVDPSAPVAVPVTLVIGGVPVPPLFVSPAVTLNVSAESCVVLLDVGVPTETVGFVGTPLLKYLVDTSTHDPRLDGGTPPPIMFTEHTYRFVMFAL
jgi:hypothetical protein